KGAGPGLNQRCISQVKRSSSLPPRAGRTVFEEDSLTGKLLADAVGFGKITASARGVARRDPGFDVGGKGFRPRRKNSEDAVGMAKRFQSDLRLGAADRSLVQRGVDVAEKREQRSLRLCRVHVVVHRRSEVGAELGRALR